MTRSEITWGAGRVVLQVRSAVFRSLRFLAECPRRCEGQAIFAVLPGISPRSALAYYLSEVPPLNFLSVASSKTPDSIRHMLGREIEAWAKKGVKVSVRESLKGELLVFHCEIQGSTDSVRQEVLREIKDSVANELSHIIIDEYEALLVNRLVDENYAYLSSRDRGVIKRKVAAALDGKSRQGSGFRDGAERSRRKSRVWARLAEYWRRKMRSCWRVHHLRLRVPRGPDTVEEVAEDHLTERDTVSSWTLGHLWESEKQDRRGQCGQEPRQLHSTTTRWSRLRSRQVSGQAAAGHGPWRRRHHSKRGGDPCSRTGHMAWVEE